MMNPHVIHEHPQGMQVASNLLPTFFVLTFTLLIPTQETLWKCRGDKHPLEEPGKHTSPE